MASSAPATESIESLRERAATLRAHLAQLTTISNASQQQQQQPSRRAAPSAPSAALNTSLSASLAAPIHSSVNAKLAHTLPGTQPLVAELNEATAWARRYRITGRSCFGVELARGKRAKEEIKEREKGKGKEREGDREREFVKKGVAVRLETFYAGSYYEPFYVVFAHTEGADDDASQRRRLEIMHHTIPHWLPLQELSKKYLGLRIRGQQDAFGSEEASEAIDKLGVATEPDLDLFLTRVTVYLNAFVARRQLLVSLRTFYSTSLFSHLDFRIFGSEASDRIIIEWDLEGSTAEDDENEEVVDRIVVVQIAFLDPRDDRLASPLEDKSGGSVLVRYVERKPATGQSPVHVVLENLSALRKLRKLPLTPADQWDMIELVKELVEETTAEGWACEQ